MKTLLDWNRELEGCASLQDLSVIKKAYDKWENEVDDIERQIKALNEKRNAMLSKDKKASVEDLEKRFYIVMKKLWEKEYNV